MTDTYRAGDGDDSTGDGTRSCGRPGNSPGLTCRYCGAAGGVDVAAVPETGISCGKATAALLTGGLSIFATGLSRNRRVSEAHCRYCKALWRID